MAVAHFILVRPREPLLKRQDPPSKASHMKKVLAVCKNILALTTVVAGIVALVAQLTGNLQIVTANIGLAPRGPVVDTARPVTPQAIASDWEHFATENGEDAANRLTLAGPPATDVSATVYGNWIHVWYRGGGSKTEFAYSGIPWDGTKPTKYPVFFNDGKVAPIGFTLNKANQVSLIYFAVKK